MANEDLLLRQAPHSVEAEQAVLGSMLIDEDCVKLVMGKLRPVDFYLKQNREIFESIYTMFSYSHPIDIMTVAEEMRRGGTYDETVTGSYLAQLMEITPTSANVMEYAKIVADKSLLRTTAEIAADILAMAQDASASGRDVLEIAEQKIFSIRGNRNTMMVHIKDVLPEVLDEIGELSENGGKIPGLSTGFSAIDRKIMGLNRSDLILLAARPGMGKTALALNIASDVARNGQTVAIFSLEMGRKQLVTRMLSVEASVDGKNLKTGALDERQWEQIAEATVILSRQNILLDDNPMLTVSEINAKCRRIDNLGLVIVDYLQLMSSSGKHTRGNENRQQVVSDMSRMLKIMAKELDVPVLCLSQLNRECETRADKRPQLSDLRESGAIEQDADIVMFLYRHGFYHPETENPNITECIVAKNRHGETGIAELYWTPEYTMFSTLDEVD